MFKGVYREYYDTKKDINDSIDAKLKDFDIVSGKVEEGNEVVVRVNGIEYKRKVQSKWGSSHFLINGFKYYPFYDLCVFEHIIYKEPYTQENVNYKQWVDLELNLTLNAENLPNYFREDKIIKKEMLIKLVSNKIDKCDSQWRLETMYNLLSTKIRTT